MNREVLDLVKDLSEQINSLSKRVDALENKGVRFKAPSVDEVHDFMRVLVQSEGLSVSKPISAIANDYFDHYESQGWTTKGGKVKDWKARARFWVRNNKQQSQPQSQPQGRMSSTMDALNSLYEEE